MNETAWKWTIGLSWLTGSVLVGIEFGWCAGIAAFLLTLAASGK